jgi:hypothetical protein
MDKRANRKIVKKCFGDDSQVRVLAGNVLAVHNRSKSIGMVQQLDSSNCLVSSSNELIPCSMRYEAVVSYRKEVFGQGWEI